MHKRTLPILVLVAIVLTVLSDNVFADWRIETLNNSYHFNRSYDFNEVHDGIGFEYEVSKDVWLGAIRYNNSFGNPSVLYKVSDESRLNDNWRAGWSVGFANEGYSDPQIAIGGYIQWKIVKFSVTPVVAWWGVSVPIK